MADDHASHAISAYGSKINKTPNIDAIGAAGMILENCFATNALCAPSRAVILTSKYSHLNGTKTHHDPPFDNTQLTYPKVLQKNGYQTAVVGKWHLKSDPTGFDYWNVLVGQGRYHNPVMIDNGKRTVFKGYATDVITDKATEFLDHRDPNKPFLLIVQHKAPHRPWEPDKKHAHMYDDVEIPQPPTLFDKHEDRASPAKNTQLRIMGDLRFTDVKSTPPQGLNEKELTNWYYQHFIKDYLRCIASVDDNVGRLMDYLKQHNLLDNTIVIYTSDQGFFLGDHGWFDKRFMFEDWLRMPFLIRYPREIAAGSRSDAIITNLDFAPTFLDFADIEKPAEMQGVSFRKVLDGETPPDWQKDMYYHYFEFPGEHAIARHYGLRNKRYKLIHYYMPVDEWEFFDLEKDPQEMHNKYDDPAYQDEITEMKARLTELRKKYKDTEPANY
jgi:arylsulfatase A-like enzyme